MRASLCSSLSRSPQLLSPRCGYQDEDAAHHCHPSGLPALHPQVQPLREAPQEHVCASLPLLQVCAGPLSDRGSVSLWRGGVWECQTWSKCLLCVVIYCLECWTRLLCRNCSERARWCDTCTFVGASDLEPAYWWWCLNSRWSSESLLVRGAADNASGNCWTIRQVLVSLPVLKPYTVNSSWERVTEVNAEARGDRFRGWLFFCLLRIS